MLVLEGLMPFLNPSGLRRTLVMVSQMNDNTLRWIGLGSMLIGAVLLALVR
ncbi:MAG: DUF2065 domain-containing protein [Pseudomonadota bacterium]